VSITVQPVNDDPEVSVTEEIKRTMIEDTNCTFALSSFVTDRDGDILTVQGPFGAAHGIVEIVDAGNLELLYTPHLNFNGNDNFTAYVLDGEGGAVEVFVNVQIGQREQT
jgi:hypothetical protein